MKKALAFGSLLAALVFATPGVAPAAAPPDHYANHPIRVKPNAAKSPSGLMLNDIRSAYGYTADKAAGAGETIAIVDAYDNPNALNDLNIFNKAMGLDPCNSSTCFQKVNQTGGTRYPRADGGWALEIALDIQWAHAMAPGAKILLVEANSNSFTDLMTAEDYARNNGAQFVSNSWGGSEFSGESAYDSHFLKPGVSFFVSAGDAGLPAEYPSSSPNVISVGGTRLTRTGTTWAGAAESTWTEGGGGCSLYEPATSAQRSFSGYGAVGCTGRATPDVSLDADPASGVSVYMSTKYQGQAGWFTVGGTSASSPMVAGRAAVAAAASTAAITVDANYVYSRAAGFFRDITTGSNGATCLPGFDLCTGRGSWLG